MMLNVPRRRSLHPPVVGNKSSCKKGAGHEPENEDVDIIASQAEAVLFPATADQETCVYDLLFQSLSMSACKRPPRIQLVD